MVPSVAGAQQKAVVTVVELRHLVAEYVGKVVVGVGVNGQRGQTEVPDGKDTYWGSQYSFVWDSATVKGRVLVVELLQEGGGRVLAECRLDLRRKWEDYKWCDFIHDGKRVGSVCLECEVQGTTTPSPRQDEETTTLGGGMRWEEEVNLNLTPRSDVCSSPIYTARSSATTNQPTNRTYSPPIRREEERDQRSSTPKQDSFYKEQLNDVVAGLRHVYSTLPVGDAVLRRQIELLMAKAGAPLDTIPKDPIKKQVVSKPTKRENRARSKPRNPTPVRVKSKRRTSSVGLNPPQPPARPLIPLREVVEGRDPVVRQARRNATRSPKPRDRDKTPGPVLLRYCDRHTDPSVSIGSTQSAPAFRKVPTLARRYGAATPSDSISSTRTAPIHRTRIADRDRSSSERAVPHNVSVNRTRPKPLPPPPSPITEVTELRLPSRERAHSPIKEVTPVPYNPDVRERDKILAALLANQTQSICCDESELSFEDLEELVGS